MLTFFPIRKWARDEIAWGPGWVGANVGNAWNGRGMLFLGQDTIKEAAKEKMALASTGVPVTLAEEIWLRLLRRTDWWMPSATRIAPACVRISLFEITLAPPK